MANRLSDRVVMMLHRQIRIRLQPVVTQHLKEKALIDGRLSFCLFCALGNYLWGGMGKSAEMLKMYSLRFLEFRVATPMQIFTTAW